MFKKACNYSNNLSKKIKENPSIKIEEIFQDELLQITIRNEAPDFLSYFFPTPTQPSEHFDEIIDYALNSKEYVCDGDDVKNPNKYIISRNAANFLSTPSKKLLEYGKSDEEKRIFVQLRKFIKNKNSKDSMAAGNFSRIFLQWYSKYPEEFEENDKDSFSMDKLVHHCVLNIQEIAYAEILERLLCVESDNSDTIRPTVLYEILQRVREMIGDLVPNEKLDNSGNSTTIYRYEKFKSQIPHLIESQPLDIWLEKLPFPDFFNGKFPKISVLNFSDEEIKTKPIIPTTFKMTDTPENRLIAYTLINIVWTAGLENGSLFDFIQSYTPSGKFARKKKMLEYLLFIGVFGYRNLMCCSSAFRILNVVVNGDRKSDINPISKKDRLDENGKDLVDKYAEYVIFDTSNISNLAVISFPVFFSHVYSAHKADESPEYAIKYVVTDEFPPKEKIKLKTKIEKVNKKGVTAFAYLAPVVLTEPAVSSELCASFCSIFKELSEERSQLAKRFLMTVDYDKLNMQIASCVNKEKRLAMLDEYEQNKIDTKEKYEMCAERMKEIDKFYLGFISYRFRLPGKEGKHNIFEWIEKIFPLSHHVYTKEDEKLVNLFKKSKQMEIIEESSKVVRSLSNNSVVSIVQTIEENAFLGFKEPNDIFYEKMSPTPLPEFKIQSPDGTGTMIQSFWYLIIKEFTRKIEENLTKAGPRDPNAKLIGD